MVEATGAGNTAPGLLAEAEAAIRDGVPVVLASRSPSGPAGAGYAFPGGGATWVRAGAILAGTLTGPKARVALALALGAGLDGTGAGGVPGRTRRAESGDGGPRRTTAWSIHGRIVTLAGDARPRRGRGDRDPGGRVIAAGSASEIEALADHERAGSSSDPAEVALPGPDRQPPPPGRRGARGSRARSVRGAGRWPRASPGSPPAHARLRVRRLADRPRLGSGRRWGGWPTAADLEAVAPGRRVALWAHDHHALWVSSRGPDRGRRRTRERGRSAGRRDPATDRRPAERHPPGGRDRPGHAPDPGADRGRVRGGPARDLPRPGRAWGSWRSTIRASSGRSAGWRAAVGLRGPGRVRVACRSGSMPRSGPRRSGGAIERGLRSGAVLGADPAGRARLGWLKLFADGSLGSRTAAMLEPFEPLAGDAESSPDRGIWVTEPAVLASWRRERPEAGIATQIHAIGDAAVRAALDAFEPAATRSARLRARIEHAQLVDPGRPGPLRRARDRRLDPAGPPALGRGPGPRELGRPGRAFAATPGGPCSRPGPRSPSGRMPRSSRSTRGRASPWRSTGAGRPGRQGPAAFGPGRGADPRPRRFGAPALGRAQAEGQRRPGPAGRRPAADSS